MKKFISVLLSLLMVFSLCLSVSADDGRITTRDELQSALDNGGTVSLTDDIDASANGLIVKKDVTLDLNGHSLKVANSNATNIKIYGATLTLMDSTDTNKDGTGQGKIYTEVPYAYGSYETVAISVNSGAHFIMESGLIDTASAFTDNSNQGQFAVGLNDGDATIDANITINGGHIKAGWYAVAGNGGCVSVNHNITVNGGILESVADYAIYHPQRGTTTINDGIVYGYAGGVAIKRGNLIVNGGTITSKGVGSTGTWGDGTGNLANAAVNINAHYGTTDVKLNNGSFIAEGNAISLIKDSNNPSTLTIAGGTYSSDISEYLSDDLVQNTDGSVTEKVYPVAIGNKKYETLKEAINESNDGDTIKVLSSLSLNKGLTLNKDITIDLGGNTIESKGMLFDIYSKVTLKNGIFKGTKFTKAGATIWLNENASLLVEKDATIDVTSNGTSSFDIGFWIDCDGATLTVNGTLKGENGVTVNGVIETDNTVNIDGATIDVTGHGLYLAGVATTNISNTNINAGSTSIEIRAGKLNIKDGTYTSVGEFKTSPNESGTTVDGAALAISQHTTKLPIDVTIDGGSFKGEYSLYEANVQGNDEESLAKVNIKINDGNFDGKFFIENNAEKSIKGGNYSVDVSKYLISGYNVAKINEAYSVVKDGEKIDVTSPTPAVDETTYDEVKKVKSDSNGILLETDLVNALQSNEKDMLNKQIPSNSKLDQIVPLDINLYSVDENGVSTKITSLNSPITINMYLPDDIVDSIKNKTIKVARFHGGVLSMLDANLNGNILTFKTDKFSTYAIVAYGAVTPTSNVADKKAGPKDLNSDGVITCDEEMGSKNWIWSESKGACVYKVSNTSVK